MGDPSASRVYGSAGRGEQRRRSRRMAFVAAAALLTGLPLLGNAAVASSGPVVVLSDPSLTEMSMPAGVTPGWVAQTLANQGIDAVVMPASEVPSDASVIVDPYGEAFPDSTALRAALSAGAAWVNLAGVPFAAPNGTPDPASPAEFGLFAPPTPSSWLAGTVRTELGAALLPALAPSSSDHLGWSLHAAAPAYERPLDTYTDAVGTDGGPAITLILKPYRVVAVGFVGNDSPLNPTDANSGALLAQLVDVAANRGGGITDAAVTHNGNQITVSASGAGQLSGTGTFPAPKPWSPQDPQISYATVCLFRSGRLVDLVRLVTNPAVVRVAGPRLLVDGTPFVVKGMVPGSSYPVGSTGASQAAMQRDDYHRMAAAGANAVRSYGYLSDWTINAAANAGLFVMDSLPLGALSPGAVTATVPWARFIGARDRDLANMLIYSLGNETQDSGPGQPSQVVSELSRLDAAIKSTDSGTHPITYAAAEEEPWLLGSLPFLDVYGYNTYGATWPLGLDTSGFDVSIKIAQVIAGARPMLITEWGVNATPSGQTALIADKPLGPVGDLESATIVHKWETILSSGCIGGYYFQWSDDLKTGLPLPVPGFSQTIGSIEYPPGSGYHPFNEEDFWGLNDLWRNPRPTLDALTYAYTGRGTAPLLPGVPLP